MESHDLASARSCPVQQLFQFCSIGMHTVSIGWLSATTDISVLCAKFWQLMCDALFFKVLSFTCYLIQCSKADQDVPPQVPFLPPPVKIWRRSLREWLRTFIYGCWRNWPKKVEKMNIKLSRKNLNLRALQTGLLKVKIVRDAGGHRKC